jgi:hypothetical protein
LSVNEDQKRKVRIMSSIEVDQTDSSKDAFLHDPKQSMRLNPQERLL